MGNQRYAALIAEIAHADSEELDQILRVVEARYRVLFPDTEIVYLALTRDDLEERERQLNLAMDFLRKHMSHEMMLFRTPE